MCSACLFLEPDQRLLPTQFLPLFKGVLALAYQFLELLKYELESRKVKENKK